MFWKGVIGYLPANIVQGIVGLLSLIAFTRLLTPEAYGAYALAFSASSLVYTLAFTWLEAAMARFYVRRAEDGALPVHFATIFRTFWILALVVPAASVLALWLMPISAALKFAVGAGLVTIPVRSLAKLAQEQRRAAGRVTASAALDMGQTAGAFAIGAGLAALGAGGAAPLIGAGVAAAACLPFVLKEDLGKAVGGRFDPATARTYAHYGVPVSLSLILALALASTDRFMLAGFLNEASVGAYHAGYSLSSRTLDVLFIWLGAAGGPACIAALEQGGRAALERAAREQVSLMVLICLPAAVGLALVAKPLADVMIGVGLRDAAARVTPWIAASGFFAGITTYYLHTAFTLGRQTRLLLAAMAIPATANFALTFILIPRFGLNGAVWATTASYAVGAAASWAMGRRVMPLPLPWTTIGRAALACAGMALAVSLVPSFGGAMELFAKAGAGVLVYGALILALDGAGARARYAQLVRALHLGAPA